MFNVAQVFHFGLSVASLNYMQVCVKQTIMEDCMEGHVERVGIEHWIIGIKTSCHNHYTMVEHTVQTIFRKTCTFSNGYLADSVMECFIY